MSLAAGALGGGGGGRRPGGDHNEDRSANNARLHAGIKRIVAYYKDNSTLISPAIPRTPNQRAKRAVLAPTFSALVRSFSSLLDVAQANRTPGRLAFAPVRRATLATLLLSSP
ncbi:hypothetical protein NEMBOFW57_010873 [Staphylotrichum longicolle]|uniref:Uncharacterized protein n=1 Tax=Staphylotrichum longicolle TaxID=669026 RepID=A0AAD4ESE4_9PEZI|nr:hypothetical protein NEMBOFW57_010873 [Staphylotrichum longicolle]